MITFPIQSLDIPSLLLLGHTCTCIQGINVSECSVNNIVVSRVSVHGRLIITYYICPCGRLPGRKITCINIVVFSLTPSNSVYGHLPGSGRLHRSAGYYSMYTWTRSMSIHVTPCLVLQEHYDDYNVQTHRHPSPHHFKVLHPYMIVQLY